MPKPRRPALSARNVLVAACVLLLLALAAVAVVSRYAAPWMEQTVRRWAAERGYEKVEVGLVGLRLFPLRASLEGLVLDAGGRRMMEVAEARLQVSLRHLLSGDLRADHVILRGTKLSVDIAGDGSLRLAGLSLGGGDGKGRAADRGPARPARDNRLGIDLVKIVDSALLVKTPHTEFALSVSDLEIRDGREIVAETVSIQGLEILALHNADDSWQIFSGQGTELAALGTGKTREEGSLEKALSNLSYRIGRFEVAEGTTITHRAIAEGEDYEVIHRVGRASISDIRSEADAGRPSRFVFESDSNRHGHVLLEGTVGLAGEEREVLLTGKVEGLELLSLSPYTRRTIGFAVDSGQADGDLELKVGGHEVEGHADVRINLLTVSTADRKKLKAFEKTLPGKITLATAVRLLSDKKGTILLKVPVSGDLSAPTFGLDLDIGHAVNNALGGIVKTGLLVAAPWAVATLDALSAQRAPSGEVTFAPLSDEIDGAAAGAVADFARAFSRKGDVLALVRGYATERELKMLPEETGKARNREVLAIAERRARKVKDLLVNEHGLAARRLVICRPEINYWDRSKMHIDPFGEQDMRKPRVELR